MAGIGVAISAMDYLGGFQYQDNVLKHFPTAEGYVSHVSGSYQYVYNYTDHLGNIRLSYGWDTAEAKLKIMEENHYYPFGMKHANYNTHALSAMKKEESNEMTLKSMAAPSTPKPVMGYNYKYNGKEYQHELGLNLYDYGARNYDAAIGRWMNMDPLAETSRRFTPYAYALNNPVYFIDPDGMQADDWKKDANGNFVFDSNLTKDNASTLLKEGESYVGSSAKVSVISTDSSGNTETTSEHSLNSDGSVTNLQTGETQGVGADIALGTSGQSIILPAPDVSGLPSSLFEPRLFDDDGDGRLDSFSVADNGYILQIQVPLMLLQRLMKQKN